MTNITIGRYTAQHGSNLPDGTFDPQTRTWQGWIEPDDKTWIAFIDAQGIPHVFLDRCTRCGGVLCEKHPESMPGFCFHRDPATGSLTP